MDGYDAADDDADERGWILKAIPEGSGMELRVVFHPRTQTRAGKVTLRVWRAGHDGRMHPLSGLGLSISVFMLVDLRDAIASALEAAGPRGQW